MFPFFILLFVDFYNFMILYWLYAIDKLNGLHELILFLVFIIILLIDFMWPMIFKNFIHLFSGRYSEYYVIRKFHNLVVLNSLMIPIIKTGTTYSDWTLPAVLKHLNTSNSLQNIS